MHAEEPCLTLGAKAARFLGKGDMTPRSLTKKHFNLKHSQITCYQCE